MQIIFKLHANRHPLPLLLHPGRGRTAMFLVRGSLILSGGESTEMSALTEGALYPGEHAVPGAVLLPVLGWQPLVQLTLPSSFQY